MATWLAENLEVRSAQERRAAFLSKFDYADSRYNYVLDLMPLKQAAGTLIPRDIEQVNTFPDMSDPVLRRATLTRQSLPPT